MMPDRAVIASLIAIPIGIDRHPDRHLPGTLRIGSLAEPSGKRAQERHVARSGPEGISVPDSRHRRPWRIVALPWRIISVSPSGRAAASVSVSRMNPRGFLRETDSDSEPRAGIPSGTANRPGG